MAVKLFFFYYVHTGISDLLYPAFCNFRGNDIGYSNTFTGQLDSQPSHPPCNKPILCLMRGLVFIHLSTIILPAMLV